MLTAVKSQSPKRRRSSRRRFYLQWDPIGNLQSRDIAQKYREEYSYDGLNRLTEARFARLENTSYASGSQPISAKQTYDVLGNICSKTVLGYDMLYNYGGASGCGLNGLPGQRKGQPRIYLALRPFSP